MGVASIFLGAPLLIFAAIFYAGQRIKAKWPRTSIALRLLSLVAILAEIALIGGLWAFSSEMEALYSARVCPASINCDLGSGTDASVLTDLIVWVPVKKSLDPKWIKVSEAVEPIVFEESQDGLWLKAGRPQAAPYARIDIEITGKGIEGVDLTRDMKVSWKRSGAWFTRYRSTQFKTSADGCKK